MFGRRQPRLPATGPVTVRGGGIGPNRPVIHLTNQITVRGAGSLLQDVAVQATDNQAIDIAAGASADRVLGRTNLFADFADNFPGTPSRAVATGDGGTSTSLEGSFTTISQPSATPPDMTKPRVVFRLPGFVRITTSGLLVSRVTCNERCRLRVFVAVRR